jgi:predicted transcriptional regulator of viral defense system
VSITALKPHQGGISQRNRAYLEKLHRAAGTVFDVGAAARALDLDRHETSRLLGYLARRGWLSRVRRGLYVAVPLDAHRSGEWIEDAWIVADSVFSPCFIGGLTACQHWDLTEQIFRTVLVVTARKVHSRDVVMQGIPFRVTVRPEAKIFGTEAVWRGQRQVQVSDPSRTIVDIFDNPQLGGGIRNSADVLNAYMVSEHRNDQLLVEYGDRLGNRTVFKRLGYLLEQAKVDAPELIAACLGRRSAGLGLLDPSVKASGRIVRRWGLRINAEVGRNGDDA